MSKLFKVGKTSLSIQFFDKTVEIKFYHLANISNFIQINIVTAATKHSCKQVKNSTHIAKNVQVFMIAICVAIRNKIIALIVNIFRKLCQKSLFTASFKRSNHFLLKNLKKITALLNSNLFHLFQQRLIHQPQ